MKAMMLSAAVSGLLSGSSVSLHAAGRRTSVNTPNLGQVASAAGLNQTDKGQAFLYLKAQLTLETAQTLTIRLTRAVQGRRNLKRSRRAY